MDAAEIVELPFVQVALPITWYQNKRVDDLRSDMNRQFAEIKKILKAIQNKLENHNERITRLESVRLPSLVPVANPP